ncbi:hypothetical protein GM3709_3909 (plasmid) [Geminocystis sp. NIES-3709]|nr:hypothetical protein GM3709_3909 [Geminocystis sp. NIES-3709]
MKKDKLITIRVNEQIRDKFNQWCNEQGLSVSEFLSNIIEDCANGSYEMSSNNKDKSNKIARQKLIALEAKIEQLSSQVASFTSMTQEGVVTERIGVLEEQINTILNNAQGTSIPIDNQLDTKDLDALIQSKIDSIFDFNSLLEKIDNKLDKDELEVLIRSQINSVFDVDSLSKKLDNKLDKNELEVLIRSQINSVFDVDSLSQKLDDKLDKDELEALIRSQINSVFDLDSLFEKIDNKLDKNELEALIQNQVDSIFSESNLLKQIYDKLDDRLDNQKVETLVESLINSTFNQDSLFKMIDTKIDNKWADLHNQIMKLSTATENNNLAIPIDKNIDKDTVKSPLDLALEEPLENKYIKSNEVEAQVVLKEDNDRSIKSEEQKVELKPLTPEFLALPTGKLTATQILKTLKIKDTGYLSTVALRGLQPNFEGFWDYLEYDTSKKRTVWMKRK